MVATASVGGTDDPVLLSKITMPGVPAWAVPRARIDDLLAAGTQGPLTSVTGPPGAGKTMAITLWAAAHAAARPLAWVTLDDYDNDPGIFWSYVLAALGRAGAAVPALPPAARGDVDHSFLLQLASVLATQDPPVLLVLDDLHVLAGPAVLDGLAYVLRNARPGLRLVSTSRMDPLLPLHRYRLAGELTEVRADHLAFTVPEAAQLLAQHQVTLLGPDLERLTRHAEGWAAGIRLAAMSLDGHPDPAQFIKEFGNEDSAITGYLVDEVLGAQPPATRKLLLRTSILDRVSADLADELTDDGQAGSLLPGVAQTNAFVQPVGHGWYRYHALFGAALRLKLRRENPGRVADLHRRAAQWFRRNGWLSEAVRHAGDSGDWPLAARMVLDELAVGRLLEPQASEPLTEAFQRMPPGEVLTDPQPLLVRAALELSGAGSQPDDTWLGAAEDLLGKLPASAEVPARLAAALIRLTLSRRTGDQDAAAGAAARARGLLAALPDHALARHPGMHAQVLSGCAATQLWAGQVDAATTTLHDALSAAAGAADAAQERADCLGLLALAEALRGRLSCAAELASEPAGGDGGEPAALSSPAAHVALAQAQLSRGELKRARGQLKLASSGAAGAPGHADPRPRVPGRRAGRAGRRPPPGDRGHGRPGPCGLVRAALAGAPAGHHRVAGLRRRGRCRRRDRLGQPRRPGKPARRGGGAGSCLAGGREHQGRPAGAGQRPGRLSPGPGRSPAGGVAGRCPAQLLHRGPVPGPPVTRARAAAGPRRAAPAAIRPGTGLAAAGAAAGSGTGSGLPPAARRRPAQPGRRPASRPARRETVPLIVEQLSDREREVLQHLSAMLSTAEIAAEMYISVNTVKTHLKSIYRKLAAAHRNEAVRRARLLELL